MPGRFIFAKTTHFSDIRIGLAFVLSRLHQVVLASLFASVRRRGLETPYNTYCLSLKFILITQVMVKLQNATWQRDIS